MRACVLCVRVRYAATPPAHKKDEAGGAGGRRAALGRRTPAPRASARSSLAMRYWFKNVGPRSPRRCTPIRASSQPRRVDASGLDLIDCSRAAGKTNTVDFRIISRALQDLARPLAPGTTRTAVVVVTGDGDFAYTISALRNVCVPTMLIFDHDRQSTVNSLMLEVADFVEPPLGARRPPV